MSDLRTNLLKRHGVPSYPPLPSKLNSAQRHLRKPERHTALPWNDYFSGNIELPLADNLGTINAFIAGTTGPLFILLHGGGYSGLTWACLTKHLCRIIECRILAPDLRGHGKTQTSDDADLSIDTLAKDVKELTEAYVNKAAFTSSDADDQQIPPIILIGHSMGGAVAAHVASLAYFPTLIGLVIVDVVEGSALQALRGMQSFLLGRPSFFSSVENGIQWCVGSGQTKNLEAARVSFPSQLRMVEGNNLESTKSAGTTDGIIAEESEELEKETKVDQKSPQSLFTWRIDLSKTEPFWRGWFEGLSSKFLSAPASKLLLLAGVDRLDKDLTIGQMQGKFQMVVLPKVGHAVHEDSPEKVADCLATFCVRNRFTTAKASFKPVFPGC